MLRSNVLKTKLASDDFIEVDSFEKTYETAYSHGLEDIYALETVDLSSVKPMGADREDLQKSKPGQNKTKTYCAIDQQLALPFPEPHVQYIDHFLLQEPIEVLLLPERIESTLKEAGCYYIYELLSQDLHKLAMERKLGSGHIQEVQNSLHEHIQSPCLYQVQNVDFAAFCLSLIPPTLYLQAASVLLESGVAELFPLKSAQRVELKSAGTEKKLLWKKQLYEEMEAFDRKQLFNTMFGKIVQVLILPWMRARGGIVRQSDLCERMDSLAVEEERPSKDKIAVPSKVVAFISSLYFPSQEAMWDSFLFPCEPGVYAESEEGEKQYKVALKQAKSYFASSSKYELYHLISLMEREAALYWYFFPEGFLYRFFRLTSHFTFVRQEKSCVYVIPIAS